MAELKTHKFKDEILELRKKEGYTAKQISEHILKEHKVQIHRRTIQDFLTKHGVNGPEFTKTPTTNVFKETMDEEGFQLPDNWQHGWLKTKDVSIFIKNNQGIIPFDQMREDFINEMKKYSPVFPKIKRERSKDSHLLVVDISDLHVGKLADSMESGEDYNSNIAKKRAIQGVQGILNKASGFDIDKILFVVGNDVLHIDNAGKTTTSGIPQDVDNMWYRNYLIARDIYIEVVNMLVQVADVHITHNPSNHDYVTGFMLADSIFCWFRNHKNITFDVTIKHRKYFTYGKNLIGTSHGDGAKLEIIPMLMATESPDWSKAVFRYVYLHHLHHKKGYKFLYSQDLPGVTVEYLRSPSGTDSWHHRNGYQGATKAIEGFIHHKEFGQIARLTHIFK